MLDPHPSLKSLRARNQSRTRRDWVKVELFLTEVEKVHGWARSWELRERLERGEVTLSDVSRPY